jgi:hypothetical protein
MSDGRDSNLSGNLSGVAKLESSEGWINWNEEIRLLSAITEDPRPNTSTRRN